MNTIPEITPEVIQSIADELRTALEAEGQYLMTLTDDLTQHEVIDDMVQAGLGAIDWAAASQIRAHQLEA